MPQQYIDATKNARSADQLYEAFAKCNANFTELYSGQAGSIVPGVTVPGLAAFPPASLSDSSMFPGGTFPTVGFWVQGDLNNVYIFIAGVHTQWNYTPING